MEVLAGIGRHDDNPYVVVGAKQGRHLVNLQKPWHRIRAQAGLDAVRIHDLRHSFASVAAAGGLSLPMIGALLGHTQVADDGALRPPYGRSPQASRRPGRPAHQRRNATRQGGGGCVVDRRDVETAD